MGTAGTERERLWALEANAVGAGAVGGLLAGIGMGLFLQFGTDMLPVFGAVAGEESALRGWLVHLVVSVFHGLVFAVAAAYPPIRDYLADFDVLDWTLAGVGYATFVVAVTIALLPLVFELPWVTDAAQSPLADVPGPGLAGLYPAAMFGLGHLVYGAILGFVYGLRGATGID